MPEAGAVILLVCVGLGAGFVLGRLALDMLRLLYAYIRGILKITRSGRTNQKFLEQLNDEVEEQLEARNSNTTYF